MTAQLPARYDHVGSFLRPAFLLEAREQKAKGQITAEQLRAVEDKAIAEIVKFQQDVGLKAITDGEFRRTYFHIDFLEQLGGVVTDIPLSVLQPDGTTHLAPPVIRVTDKVTHAKNIQLADFQYLKSQVAAGCTPKVTIPSPTMLHFRGGRAGISRQAYPELDPVFYDDVAKAYGDELRALAAAGCTYVQMDDTNLAYLCDEKMREAARQRGDDPNELPHRYAQFVNKVVAQKPAGMTKGKTVVLGLVTTKFGDMESKDALKRRIDEAAKYAPLEQLALSPQCGFSSTVHGNNIAVQAQRDKLRLVIETAQDVWGEA